MNDAKTKNTFLNVVIGLFMQIIIVGVTFVSRTIFIAFLNEEFLGLNGLYSNILTVLSMAELGFGTAMSYNLYKAISKNDLDKINSLLKFFKTVYLRIGLIVFVAGLLFMPFLSFTFNEPITVDVDIYFVFFLFLANTSFSYLFSFNLSFLDASQRRRTTEIIIAAFTVLRELAAFLVLYLTKNYYLYLVNTIVFTVLMYVFADIFVRKKYNFIKLKDAEPLESSEKKTIFTNVLAIMFYKVAGIVLLGTDSIMISSMVGIIEVAILTNYQLIINFFKAIIFKITSAASGSLGLDHTNNDPDRIEKNLFKFNIVMFWVVGYASIGMFFLLNDVVTLWVRNVWDYDTSFLFDQKVVFALVLVFFIEGISIGPTVFRQTLGLFDKSRSLPFIAIITKIVLGIVLGIYFGVFGILLASSIARLVSFFWMDPYLVYFHSIKKSMLNYFMSILKFLIITVFAFVVTHYMLWDAEIGVTTLILKMIVISLIVNIIYLVVYAFDKNFKELVVQVLRIFKKNH